MCNWHIIATVYNFRCSLGSDCWPSDLLMLIIGSNDAAAGSATSHQQSCNGRTCCGAINDNCDDGQSGQHTQAEVMPWLRDGNCAFALCPIVGGGRVDIWRDRCDRRLRKILEKLRKFCANCLINVLINTFCTRYCAAFTT